MRFWFMVVIIALMPPCVAQDSFRKVDPLFSQLSQEEQLSFRRTLDHAVALLIKKEGEALYELLEFEGKEPKEKFVRGLKSYSLKRFVPYSITYIPPNSNWMVLGCGFWERRKRDGVVSSIHLKRTKDGWRVSPVGIVLFDKGHTQHCKD